MSTMSAETTIDFGPAEKILDELDSAMDSGSDSSVSEHLIPLLQELQKTYGYLPPQVLRRVSKRTGISMSRMYGVITFYTQFYLEPRGRHIIRCCEGTACHVKGGKKIAETIERELKIGTGETTADGEFTLEAVSCLGACALAPLVMVDDDYHGKMSQEKATKLLKKQRKTE